MTSVHWGLFSGLLARGADLGTFQNLDEIPDLNIIKNTYGLTDLFPASWSICVSEKIKVELQAACKARFRKVAVSKSYYYPFSLGTRDYAQDVVINDELSSGDIVQLIAEKFSCSFPGISYYEMIAPRYRDMMNHYHDWRTVSFADDGSGVIFRPIQISSSLLTDWGIGDARGYYMTESVFAILSKYLIKPFFWTCDIDIE